MTDNIETPAETPAPADAPAADAVVKTPENTPAETPDADPVQTDDATTSKEKPDDNDGDDAGAKKEDESLLFDDDKADEDGEKSDEDSDAADDKEKKEADGDNAPVEFKTEDLVVPEDMPIPDDMKDNMAELAKELSDPKLTTQEKMQKATDMHVKMQQRQQDDWQGVKKAWADECKADEFIGGENLKPTVKAVNATLKQFGENKDFGGSPELMAELRADLTLMGLGNKKSFLTLMNNISKATADPTDNGAAGTGAGAGEKKDTAHILYPDQK